MYVFIWSVSRFKYISPLSLSLSLSLHSVLIFEDKANGAPCKPEGPPPKRDIASLP